jgi:hypothetical protein
VASNQIARFSLHKARSDKECTLCGCIIAGGGNNEYWRAKGGGDGFPRTICCLCHYLFGFPDDGWDTAPDGRLLMSTSAPQESSP